MLSENIDLWEQNLKQIGRQEGRQEGLQTGREETLSAVLLKLLEKKHGRVSDAMRKQIANSPYEQMQCWLDKILDEQTVDNV